MFVCSLMCVPIFCSLRIHLNSLLIYIGNQVAAFGNNPTSVDILGEQLKEITVVIKASNKQNNIYRLLHMWWVLWCYKKQAHLVLIDTYSTLNFYYAVTCGFWCKILKLKYIPILRGGNLPDRLKTNPRLCRFLLRNATHIISPSAYLVNAFDQHGYNIIIIPNNVQLEQYPFELRESVEPKLLYVRALQKLYNPSMAIKVLAKVREIIGKGELCMIGPDKDNSLSGLKKLASELGVEEYVTFTGKLSKKEWITLAANYDIFINTTHFDNMPVSVIEAMALGLPVISTNVGGLPYLIKHGNTGLLVNDSDTIAMVEGVITLCKQPSLAAAISSQARTYVNQYDWQVVKNNWAAVLTIQ